MQWFPDTVVWQKKTQPVFQTFSLLQSCFYSSSNAVIVVRNNIFLVQLAKLIFSCIIPPRNCVYCNHPPTALWLKTTYRRCTIPSNDVTNNTYLLWCHKFPLNFHSIRLFSDLNISTCECKHFQLIQILCDSNANLPTVGSTKVFFFFFSNVTDIFYCQVEYTHITWEMVDRRALSVKVNATWRNSNN